jgi:hypothetical protein
MTNVGVRLTKHHSIMIIFVPIHRDDVAGVFGTVVLVPIRQRLVMAKNLCIFAVEPPPIAERVKTPKVGLYLISVVYLVARCELRRNINIESYGIYTQEAGNLDSYMLVL